MDQPHLLVIGAGHLGRRIAALWQKRPGAVTYAETRTTTTHAALSALGCVPRLRDAPTPSPMPWVVFSIPPSAPDDYAAEAIRALGLWNGEGRAIMVSSTGVYTHADDGVCQEDGPLATTPRAERLLNAEQHFTRAGGAVVRLAGLYSEDRGPHRVYVRRETSAQRPDGRINLIHYDDAASLVLAALDHAEPGGIYMGCDDEPAVRQRIVDATLASARYRDTGAVGCTFTGTDGPLGRMCDNTRTRKILQWTPQWPTFFEWIASQ